MRISQKAKYALAVPAFVVASVVTQFTQVLPTYAATLTWTGGGDGTSFSDGDNWSTGSAPINGDAVRFGVDGLSAQQVLDNDISGLTLVGIMFDGTANTYNGYTLQGNPITISSTISNAITGPNADYVTPTIQNNLVLNGNTVVDGVNIGVDGSTLNLQSHMLSVTGGQGCGQTVESNLSGSGLLNVSGDRINFRGTSPSYTGAISITGKAAFSPEAFGAASTGTTVSGSGELTVVHSSNASLAEPLTLSGTGSFSAGQNWISGCAGGSGPAVTLTATGGVTLNSNFVYKGENNFVVNEPYTANGHTFTVGSGVSGSLTTPSGSVEAPTETLPLDGNASGFVTIGNKQTGILNGTRDTISVQAGGLIKGTGTTTNLYINDGGIVAPGNSPGTLTVLESFTLTGTYQAELLNTSTYDKLAVGEDYSGGSNAVFLNSGAALNVVLYDGWSIKQGDKFTIIDNLSSTAVMGTFDGVAEGAQIVVDGITFSVSYVGGDGNDVVLTALNTGTDPDAPNTGVARFVAANPLVLAALGLVSAGLLIAIAMRRKSTR